MNPLELPLFIPAVVAVTALALAGAGPLAHATGAGGVRCALVLIAFGVVAAATLTPQAPAFEGVHGSGTCDVTRLRPADLDAYLEGGEALGNVLLFLPLGIALGLLPPSRTWTWLVALAIALPFVVEGLQMALPALDRACQAADVVDNLLGLGIGLALGAPAEWGVRRGRQRSHPCPEEVDEPAREPRAPS
jgi:VanZ like family